MMRSNQARLAATRRTLVVAALMLAVAASTASLKPVARPTPTPPNLDALLPEAFADWRRAPLSDAVLPKEFELKPGEAVAYRAFRDEAGRLVMLVAAYGPPLGDSVRLHRPESCYVAQGFEILSRRVKALSLAGARAKIVGLKTKGPARDEVVTYWLRSGATFSADHSAMQFDILKSGTGQALDGALVRVSTPGRDDVLFDIHERFLSDFATALSPDAREILIGEAAS
jgi:EpsI family protein